MSRARVRRADPAPLVSVVVPAWNAEATLAATVDSVARQTYCNLEIIIVDDGSNDGTPAIAERFCATEPRARLIRKENGGVASARNRGIAEAKGEWVAPIDSDDLWHPTKIEKQVAAAQSAVPTPGFVYCWRRLIDSEDRVIVSGLRCAFEGSAFMRLAYFNAVECGSSLLLSREAAAAVGGYDESLRARGAQGCEDMLLQLQVARRFPVALVPEHLVAWRVRRGNMSSDFDQMARSCMLVFDDLAEQGLPVPRTVVNRAMAKITFELAEQRALAGRFGATALFLARAIRLDPGRTSALLIYRLARSLARRLSKVDVKPPSPSFADVDPRNELPAAALALQRFRRLLDRQEEQRLARLAAEEPALTQRASSARSASAA